MLRQNPDDGKRLAAYHIRDNLLQLGHRGIQRSRVLTGIAVLSLVLPHIPGIKKLRIVYRHQLPISLFELRLNKTTGKDNPTCGGVKQSEPIAIQVTKAGFVVNIDLSGEIANNWQAISLRFGARNTACAFTQGLHKN